jgi:hypothetical protein
MGRLRPIDTTLYLLGALLAAICLAGLAISTLGEVPKLNSKAVVVRFKFERLHEFIYERAYLITDTESGQEYLAVYNVGIAPLSKPAVTSR